jgi:hypothetical protein
MGRHAADRQTLGNQIAAPISTFANSSGISRILDKLATRRAWGLALSAALVLVTVVDPYSGNLAANAAEGDYVNYFESNQEPAATVQITRGGYNVLVGSEVSKVFVETAAVPAKDTVQAIAYGKLKSFGWGLDQYSCLVKLWNRESNWRINAYNSASGAYGIPQALPGNKMATAGPDWLTNPETQIVWGLNYIHGRYGSPCSALAHSDQLNWY